MTLASHAPYLPPVPGPPHDPRSLRLDHRARWRALALDGVMARPADGVDPCGDGVTELRLAPDPAAAATLGSPGFGGLAAPLNVARAADGGLLLLDRQTALLKRFDGCDCTFLTVPHTGGIGGGPRQLNQPGGIAACGELLLIADTGNQRISVFSQYGYILRAHWTPPPDLAGWQPVDVAARKGLVAVADPAQGGVHFFNGAGRWLRLVGGLGAVTAVTFDRHGRLFVSTDGADEVVLLSGPEFAVQGTVTWPDEVQEAFAPPPVRLTVDGVLDLGHLCLSGGVARFDLTGTPVGPAVAGTPLFLKAGSYLSEPLDSRLYKCQWDRVELALAMPGRTRLRVQTYTAETPIPAADLALLPDAAWSSAATITSARVIDGAWDASIRSQPGRYMWLRLHFHGDGFESPRIAAIKIDFPRISLRRYLPAVFGEEPVSADFTDRFLAVLDRTQRGIEAWSDRSAEFYDPLSAPAETGRDFLTWLASWVGVTLDRHLPLDRRRKILKSVGKLFTLRGTKSGLRQMLMLYLGLDQRGCRDRQACCAPCATTPPPAWQPPQLILEHFSLRRWLFVNTGRLGNDARLWGEKIVNRTRLAGEGRPGPRLGTTQLKTAQDPHRDPFHVYAHRFSVFLPAWLGRVAGRKRAIDRLVRAESPAHTEADIIYVEPRFRVGTQSMIGLDAVIGCYPQGIELDHARLGRATIVSSHDERTTPMRVGHRAAIGQTTSI